MKLQQSLWAHGIALVVASGLAWTTWTKEETPVTLTRDRVQVWNAQVDQIESLRFETEKKTVEISAHKDAAGRWYQVRVDREMPGPAPHAHGAGGAPPAAPAPTRETQTFVSVTEGDKLAESLAPLMALRAVGRVEGEREKDFGLDEPTGTLMVRIGGKDRSMVIGGVTPGGNDRYARIKETGEVFAVPGDLVRRLEQAENRLFERELHVFGEEGPTRAKLQAGERSRELVAIEGKIDGWGSVSSPQEQDETASNWMGKVGKLRVKSYIEDSKLLEGQKPFLQVEYFRSGKALGLLELFKLPSLEPPAQNTEGASANRYVARSRHSRWPVELMGSSAADIDQDLASLFE